MSRRLVQLLALIGLTGISISMVALALAPAANRSARAQPIGFSAKPLSVQAAAPFTIDLQLVANTLDQPVYVTSANDDSGRLFVVERAGRIRVIKNGLTQSTPYLDIHTKVESGFEEQGLLSMAFDPEFKTNGIFYVDYTTNAAGHDGDTIIARYVVNNPALDVPVSLTVTNLITIDQPQVNHNGGQLQFGVNDDYLYIGMGDGGNGGDTGSGHQAGIGNGQYLGTLLGKILRINVRGVPTYTIPASNPFTQTLGAKKEIWAYGLRNPWRFSFDRSNGDLFIGDVGQDCWEEIDYQPAGSHGGENYGWRLMEGFHYYQGSCDAPLVPPGTLITLTRPITDYYHGVGDSNGDAVSGGYIYRGSQYPWLNGIYFFADYGSGNIWAEQQTAPGNWASYFVGNAGFNVSSFGEDQYGELYVADIYGGQIYKITSSQPTDYSRSIKSASDTAPHQADVLTYTILLRNSGNYISNTLRVTDVIPIGLSYLSGSFTVTRGTLDDSNAPMLTWSGVMSNVSSVTLTYAVSVTTNLTQTVSNTVTIDPGLGAPFTRSAAIIINGLRVYLPLTFKNY